MGSECVLTAEQLERINASAEAKAKLPSIAGRFLQRQCPAGTPARARCATHMCWHAQL